MPQATLIYVQDPMCSWCWGFRPTLARLREVLPENIAFRNLLGGLAPDTDQPMPESLRQQLQQTWRRIEARIPGTRFNYDFWTRCQPRRATWPACRAVIAARFFDQALEEPMILAIQEAYYLEARNPSDEDTLIDLAQDLGLPLGPFSERLRAAETQQQLEAEIAETRRLGVSGFPALVLQTGEQSFWPIGVAYTDPDEMRQNIEMLTGLKSR
ncbi:MAG: DsbA family protein [Gammaproteobacteria bacterium]|nr:MAG: DsbA family protein [Gammaproteobacteria bacterium]